VTKGKSLNQFNTVAPKVVSTKFELPRISGTFSTDCEEVWCDYSEQPEKKETYIPIRRTGLSTIEAGYLDGPCCFYSCKAGELALAPDNYCLFAVVAVSIQEA